MFVDGAYSSDILYAAGQSSSKDLGFPFSYGLSDAVLMVINVTSDAISVLKHIGFGGGESYVQWMVMGVNSLHMIWNENNTFALT